MKLNLILAGLISTGFLGACTQKAEPVQEVNAAATNEQPAAQNVAPADASATNPTDATTEETATDNQNEESSN